jgi:hypothetical protein
MTTAAPHRTPQPAALGYALLWARLSDRVELLADRILAPASA